jgi:phytoene desaturase
MAAVVVIGAGVAGLAAAARLAALGHRVTVLEQAATVGGKLGRFCRTTEAGEFRFDTGPSLLTLPQVFADLFAATGSTLDAELDLVPVDPLVRHVFPDGSRLDSYSDPAVFADRIAAALGANAAADWRRLWIRCGQIWDAAWRNVLRSPVDSPVDLVRLGWRLPSLAAIAPGRTLRGLGQSYLRDPRLRMLLDRYATYGGADPRRAPAALAAIPFAELTYGGWYVRGGLASLADALLARCTELGVRVELGTAATRIEAAAGRVTGVHLAGGQVVPADIVVANADAATVYSRLWPDRRRLAALAQRSLAGFVLLLGLRGRTPDLSHHTVFFPRDYDAEFDAIFGSPARPVPDPAVFVSAPDDPRVRPDGHEAWFVLVNAPPHVQGRAPSNAKSAIKVPFLASGVDWREPGLAGSYADRMLEVLATRGLDIRHRILFREILTPADLADATWSPGGAIYGTPAHGLMRPPSRGPVRGMFLVGGSTHPGGGLPLVALSAEIVARRIGPA